MRPNRISPGPKVIEPDLSYLIVAAFYRVFKGLGPTQPERLCVRALALVLAEYGLRFKLEHPVPVFFEGRQIGLYKVDMLVEDCIIIEVKTSEILYAAAKAQVRNYLLATGLELGILLHFGPRPQFHRILGPRRLNNR
jgi:GxxExxY protein